MDNKQIIYFSETHPGMTLKEFADSLKEKEEKLINIGLNAHIVKFPTVENIAA